MDDFFQIGKGDLLPAILIQATTRIDGKLVPFPGLDEPGVSLTFTMTLEGGAVKINAQPAVIVDGEQAILRYDPQGTDTDTAGHYEGKFRAVIDGRPVTIPNGPRKIRIQIT